MSYMFSAYELGRNRTCVLLFCSDVIRVTLHAVSRESGAGHLISLLSWFERLDDHFHDFLECLEAGNTWGVGQNERLMSSN